MSRFNRQTSASIAHALCTASLMVVASLLLMACPSVDQTRPEEVCDEATLCDGAGAPLCGQDGQIYACGALARCEGAIIDPSGEACRDVPYDCPIYGPCPPGSEGYCEGVDENGCAVCGCTGVTCEPIACNLYCESGYAVDENGCETCACNDDYVCMYQQCEPLMREGPCYPSGDGGCEECTCEGISCSPGDSPAEWMYEECWPGTEPTCEAYIEDFVWRCAEERVECGEEEIISCPPDTYPSCEDFSDGRQGWVCRTEVFCPEELPALRCLPGEEGRGADLDGDECEDFWCDPIACPEAPIPECEQGIVLGRDAQGCTTFVCGPAVCDTEECSPIECEYGGAIDEFGCAICGACREPACEPVVCNLFCEDGFEVDAFGCEFCECKKPEPFCEIDEDCALDEVCVLDFSEPSLCCDAENPNTCTVDVPLCAGMCEERDPCMNPGEMCANGGLCRMDDRSDCCGPAEACNSSLPVCPLLCLEGAP